MVGSQAGIPSRYSRVSFSTFLSSLKYLLVFFNFFWIVLVAFLKRSASKFLSLSAGSLVCGSSAGLLCGRRLSSSCLILASLVSATASCCRLSCLILCCNARASDGITTIANITSTEVATKSFLGKPETKVLSINVLFTVQCWLKTNKHTIELEIIILLCYRFYLYYIKCFTRFDNGIQYVESDAVCIVCNLLTF